MVVLNNIRYLYQSTVHLTTGQAIARAIAATKGVNTIFKKACNTHFFENPYSVRNSSRELV